MYEGKNQTLAPRSIFLRRMWRSIVISIVVLGVTLVIGMLGYHYLAPCAWIDAFHNASMILSGMGPVIFIDTFWGKIFSSFYALLSGLVFVTNIGLLLAPIFHRVLHQFHLDE